MVQRERERERESKRSASPMQRTASIAKYCDVMLLKSAQLSIHKLSFDHIRQTMDL